jgi:hypothetical protein
MSRAAAGQENPAADGIRTAVLSKPIRHRQGDDLVSQALGPNTIKRLAFIRFLYGQGLEQAARPQPLAATALLSFHDAVEMFLLLAAEHLGVNLDKNTPFDGYWTQIAAQASVQLPSRNAMRRMNSSRVNFKHHGSIPSATDLDQFRGDVTTFFTDATQAVFDAGFTSIDMTDLVTQQAALTKIRDAETHASQGDYIETLELLKEALHDLLDSYTDREHYSPGANAFSYSFPPVRRDSTPAWARDYITRLTDAAAQTQRVLRVLAVGLDYQRYKRFQMLTPRSLHSLDGQKLRAEPFPGLQVGDEDYQFCKLFVIETAIHLAEMDLDLNVDPSLRQP